MRADMDRVVIERPRANRSGAVLRKRVERSRMKRMGEDAPTKATMSPGRRFGYDCKNLADLINPLYRWLDKQVGRPWDKVWSEVCQTLKGGTTSLDHIKGHVESGVTQNHDVRMVDGFPHYSGRRGLNPMTAGDRYVDDKGFLRMVPRIKENTSRGRYKSEVKAPPYVEKDGKFYKEIEGIWFELTMVPYVGPWLTFSQQHKLPGLWANYENQYTIRDKVYYCTNKRTISRKEKRALEGP